MKKKNLHQNPVDTKLYPLDHFQSYKIIFEVCGHNSVSPH